MWPFRRRSRPEPVGSVRRGEHSDDAAAYAGYLVSESRFPETFETLWSTATEQEIAAGVMRRWASLVPVRHPQFGVADLRVEFAGATAGYLRPPHLGTLAARIDAEQVASMEVPALIQRGPGGPSVMLRVDDPA